MSRTPTAIEKDRCDAYRKALNACTPFSGDDEAIRQLRECGADLKPALTKGRIDHAGWRFYLDRSGVIHCVKLPPSAILAQARRPSR